MPTKDGGLAFLCPEYIEDYHESYGMDLWAFGCIIFYMLTGREPFEGADEEDLISEIVSGNLKWGDEKISKDAEDLIIKLTQIEPAMRLGAGLPNTPQHFSMLKSHPWFKGLAEFSKLYLGEIPFEEC